MGYYISYRIDWYIWTVLPLLGSTGKNRYIYVHMMDGWMMDGWMDGWIDRDKRMDRWMENRCFPLVMPMAWFLSMLVEHWPIKPGNSLPSVSVHQRHTL